LKRSRSTPYSGRYDARYIEYPTRYSGRYDARYIEYPTRYSGRYDARYIEYPTRYWRINTKNMLAIIKTGGKQYLVSPGQKIKIEKIEKKEGAEITFSDVLLVEKNKKTEIGIPRVAGAKVLGKVISQGRGKKVIAFKYHPKTRYRRKKGHRQAFTEVEITQIEI